MGNFFTGNAVWHLVQQSDVMTKAVLLLLLFMSVVCWTIFFYKIIVVKIKAYHLKKCLSRLKNVTNFEELLSIAQQFSKTLPGYYITESLVYIKKIAQARKGGLVVLTDRQWALVQDHMDQTMDILMQREESYLSVLSASGAIAPLIGLFGTVWGLVHAFIRISERQSADITTVAPGISEAFITTLAGLLVAIPSLFMYHYLASRVRNIESLLLTLHDKIVLLFFPLSSV
jgi:biopolymer transport protein ExbB/TolQ